MTAHILDFCELRRARQDQRSQELRFKLTAEGRTAYSVAEPSLAETMAHVESAEKSAQAFHSILVFWKRLAKRRDRELAAALRKIARLEKRLAKLLP
ncbi:MAG: hypothetical protein HOO99_07125 [Hyphomicrobiaceae bacterium]|nr:hypothetical protein [Hyphomicrobiaceae bacterium]